MILFHSQNKQDKKVNYSKAIKFRIDLDFDDSFIYVPNADTNLIDVFDWKLNAISSFGVGGANDTTPFSRVFSITIDKFDNNNFYVIDNNRDTRFYKIYKYDNSLSPITTYPATHEYYSLRFTEDYVFASFAWSGADGIYRFNKDFTNKITINNVNDIWQRAAYYKGDLFFCPRDDGSNMKLYRHSVERNETTSIDLAPPIDNIGLDTTSIDVYNDEVYFSHSSTNINNYLKVTDFDGNLIREYQKIQNYSKIYVVGNERFIVRNSDSIAVVNDPYSDIE